MGDIVALSDDIEQVGRDFGAAASGIYEVLTLLGHASNHVRDAFHNHPEQAHGALAPFRELHGTIAQVEQLASVVAVTLIDVARSYRANDAAVATGWDQAAGANPPSGFGPP